MPLDEYGKKRDFAKTSEPPPGPGPAHQRPIFVVQEHHASHLHYDFRLEADGVLKSWAVPKGPSLDPAQKRLAVRVEDHPLGYAGFAGTIPEGQYGAGHVAVWDHGTYEAVPAGVSLTAGIAAGRIEFALHGDKLRGGFTLVRMKGRGGGKENWLLIKKADEFARREGDGEAAPSKPAPAATPRVTRRAKPPADGVEITHPDRVIDPTTGATKEDVADYYRRIAPRLIPFLKDRPATLERLPDGLGEGRTHFWQKNTPASYPDWIPRIELPSETGKSIRYALVNDAETLLYLVNQGTLTFHTWFSRTAALDRPDFVLFDLDPGPAPFGEAVRVAHELRRVLEAGGTAPGVKTSGKTGLHVLVPWAGGDFAAARDWAAAVAGRVAGALADVATTEIRKVKRGGRVYIDVMQNARGHHAVPPYVLRAVPGLPVSTPLAWRELTPDLDPAKFTVRTLFRRLARQKTDPLADLLGAGRAAPAGVS